MGWLILATIVLLAGIVALFIGKVDTQDFEFSTRGVGIALLAVALSILALDSYTIVPTRNIAVQTSFGKPVGTLDNGFHWIRPWSSTQDFDATIQTLKLSADKDDNGEPISVRLANGATATVDVTVQWQVDPNADITQLYLDYRNFDNIGTNVIRRQLSAALNDTFETYDPLAAMETDPEKINNGPVAGATLADLAKKANAKLASALPTGLTVRSLLIPKIVFDGAIQDKINQYLAAIAETQIAQQQLQTAFARKAANEKLAEGSNSPGVLYQNCLDTVERLVRDGKVLPAAFTCGLPPTTVVPVK